MGDSDQQSAVSFQQEMKLIAEGCKLFHPLPIVLVASTVPRMSLSPTRQFSVDQLQIRVLADRDTCGQAAAVFVSEHIRRVLNERDDCAVAFAAAPSQVEFLDSLAEQIGIDWDRVISYQIDEYIGVDDDDPRRLYNWMDRHLYCKKRPGQIRCMNPLAGDPDAEAMRYGELLKQRPIDICCQGIGQSGHMAYNDPHVANFQDMHAVKVVQIDQTSREQQVTDGTVDRVEDAIASAYTLTIPTLLRAAVQSVVCPGKVKAPSVHRTLTKPLGIKWPATALRAHDHAVMFVDSDAMSEMDQSSSG
jgi:glucosamine-6-phosphate deaminase